MKFTLRLAGLAVLAAAVAAYVAGSLRRVGRADPW